MLGLCLPVANYLTVIQPNVTPEPRIPKVTLHLLFCNILQYHICGEELRKHMRSSMVSNNRTTNTATKGLGVDTDILVKADKCSNKLFFAFHDDPKP